VQFQVVDFGAVLFEWSGGEQFGQMCFACCLIGECLRNVN
jgi:hypothetical protein